MSLRQRAEPDCPGRGDCAQGPAALGGADGLGFAGALAEIGLPEKAMPLALLCFNVGVEIGQLLFVAFVLALAVGLRSWLSRWRPTLQWTQAYAIGAIASYWLIERKRRSVNEYRRQDEAAFDDGRVSIFQHGAVSGGPIPVRWR